jgi:PAS domain-containing protein
MRQDIRNATFEFIWAVLVVAAAWGATEALYLADKSLRGHGSFAFFLAAIAIVAWRGRWIAAVVALVLSSLSVAWLMPPDNSFRIANSDDVVRLVLFICLGLLITYLHFARNRAVKSLRETDHRLHFSLDSSGVACWDANVANGTFWKSHNLPEIFGRTNADFATTYEGFFAYVHPEDREFFHLAAVGGEGNERNYEIAHRIIRGDGTIQRVNTRGRMYLNGEGRLERMVGTVFLLDNKLATPGAAAALSKSVAQIASQFMI